MSKVKKIVEGIALFVFVYALVFTFSPEHGHINDLDDAQRQGTSWTCPKDDSGPFWDNGKSLPPVCHAPVRVCPVLWFPFISESPCPYKDPLGGPYTEDDLFMLRQSKHWWL